MAKFFKRADVRDVTGVDISIVDLLSRYSDEYAIFFETQFKREADIIIFSRNAVHIIEVKDKRGTITIDDEGRWWVDGELISNRFAGRDESPPIQAENTAIAFKEELQKIYKKMGKKFTGKVYPYVLIPHANEETRSNLREVQYGWARVISSLEDLPRAIAKRDKDAAATTDFVFTPEDIQQIARKLRMVQTYEIGGIRISAPTEQKISPMPPEREPSRTKWAKWAKWLFALAGVFLLVTCFAIIFILFSALSGVSGVLPKMEKPVIQSPSPTFAQAIIPTPTAVISPTPVVLPSPTPTLKKVPSPTSAPTAIPSPTKVKLPSPTPTRKPVPNPTPSPVPVEFKWEKNGLILSVKRVEILKTSFRIWMSVTNNTGETIVLPLFKNFFVVDNLGNQYEADPFSSTLPTHIAPGATVSGYANIPSPVDKNATSIKVIFSDIYGGLKFVSTSIVIEGIPLR
jgi:hypothetical protein